MSEHMFAHGPDVRLNDRIIKVLDRAGKPWGFEAVTYPRTFPRWAFHGPNRGFPHDREAEDAIRRTLNADPEFRAWCERHDYRLEG